VLLVIGFAIIAVPLLLVFVLLPGSPPEPLPSPNGYDDLQSVAASVVSNPGDWRTQDVEQLRAVLAPNSNALTVVRDALKKEWAVPISYGTNFMNVMMPNLPATKALAYLFFAEGRLAELESRTNDAVKAFVNCIELGHKSAQQGLIIHELVGIACKTIGKQAMQSSWPAADDITLSHVLNSLAEMDHDDTRVDETVRRDRNWGRASSGLLRYAWVSLMTKSTMRNMAEQFRTKSLRSETEVRLLRTDIAIELFRRKHARAPATLDELVPEFLSTVPIDPFSGKPLLYRQTTNSYLLYSVGPDKHDDHGASLTTSSRAAARTATYLEDEPDKGDIVSTPPQRR
jgi:hypothetical protein